LYEDPYIALEMQGQGHVLVSGDLVVLGECTQRLQFGFLTDQTVLGPLIADLTDARDGRD